MKSCLFEYVCFCAIFSVLNFLRVTNADFENCERCCELPKQPDFGQWEIVSGEAKALTGKVPEYTVIRFTCNDNYTLDVPGPKPGLANNHKGVRLCWDGTWNYPPPVCKSVISHPVVCGQRILESYESSTTNGQRVQIRDYPWTAAVYSVTEGKFRYACVGSMLTQKVILTGANCVSNEEGDSVAPEERSVGVGKYYNKYTDNRDTDEAQYSAIEKIIIPTSYKGNRRNYANDMAVLITKDVLLLSKVVQPICFRDLPQIPLANGLIGEVSGWFKEYNGLPSEELAQLKIPYTQDSECYKYINQDWLDKYLTIDKMCAGQYNISSSVCAGMTGSGLVFKNHKDNRYYIHGIASISPRSPGDGICRIYASVIYTKVAFHYDWLEEVIAQYAI